MSWAVEAPIVAEREQETCARGEMSSVKHAVVTTFEHVAAAQEMTLAPLDDELVLLESGLDSLCFAIIVASLEDNLGYDPFTEAEDVFFPITFGDFVRFYERGR
jgi:hypothetical protein